MPNTQYIINNINSCIKQLSYPVEVKVSNKFERDGMDYIEIEFYVDGNRHPEPLDFSIETAENDGFVEGILNLIKTEYMKK